MTTLRSGSLKANERLLTLLIGKSQNRKELKMYGKNTSPKTSLRPKARPNRGPKVGEGSTQHPTGKNINEQRTIVFTRAKPKNRGK